MPSTAQQHRRHYGFEDTEFRTTVAHDGTGQIRTCRVEDRAAIGAANFLDLTIVPPGSSIGVHTHGPADEEIYVVVSGAGLMRLEEEEFMVGPGDVIVNNRRGTHGLVNTGDAELRLVVVEVPAASLDEGSRA
jgi:mannose-6-phosphate isomerase-like protein (cupin superfamily)